MIHVYGVVDELEALPPLPGIEDAPLERRRIGELELVVSVARTPASAEVSREAVLRHAEVVEELASRSRAVLPAQFGRSFADDEELASAVRTQADELARGLSRVRGCVEFGLRAFRSEEVAGGAEDATSGAEYMRTRLAQVRRQDRLVAELHEPLARLARATVLTRGPASGEIKAAYLVPEDDVSAFREAVARLETNSPELTVVCTGPWPPYSFAAGREDAG